MSAGHALPPPFLLPSRHLLPAIYPSLLDHAQDAPPALEPTKDAPTAEAEEELLPILFVLNGGVQVTKGHGPLLTLPLRSESSSALNRSSSCYGRTAGEDAKMRTEERGLHIRMKMHHPWCREMDAVAATGDSSMALNRRSRRCPSIGQICGNWRNMKQQR